MDGIARLTGPGTCVCRAYLFKHRNVLVSSTAMCKYQFDCQSSCLWSTKVNGDSGFTKPSACWAKALCYALEN